ncbi:MAG: hypothetical protein RLZZ429_236 [Bacteroidota bacterium]|jgi:hypothetical protein
MNYVLNSYHRLTFTQKKIEIRFINSRILDQRLFYKRTELYSGRKCP